MSKARILLALLIGFSPAFAFCPGLIGACILAGVGAVGLAIISVSLRPVETDFFISFAKQTIVPFSIPAIWILIQTLPISSLEHPMWVSAAAAIGHSLSGAITVDLGQTVAALGVYLSLIGVGYWSAAVAVDRQRAETLLFSLLVASLLASLLTLAGKLLSNEIRPSTLQLTDFVAGGVLISAVCVVRAFERIETQRAAQNPPYGRIKIFILSALSLVFCAFVLAFDTPAQSWTPVVLGLGVFASVILVRRFWRGSWTTLALALPLALLAAVFIATSGVLSAANVTLFFSQEPSSGLLAMTKRMLDDAPITGTGAGTFSDIATIYRDISNQMPNLPPPTAASALAIELGKPMLWLLASGMIVTILFLLRRAMQRGRDSFYATGGASFLITLLGLSFLNAGTLSISIGVMTSSTLGLAFAQSKSRSTQQ